MADWTDDMTERLRDLWDTGLSTSKIGRELGVSKNAVVGKAHRLDLAPRPSPIHRGTEARPRVHRAHRVGAVSLPPLIRWCEQCGGLLGVEQQRFCGVGCNATFQIAARPAPAPKPRRIVIAPPAPVSPFGTCQYALNDGRPWLWCEAATKPGSPYCAEHHHRCHRAELAYAA